MRKSIEHIVKKATAGDQDALEGVVLEVKDLVYNLALRMLLFPEDAKDATQEILVKIITSLSTFRGDSAFKTWVYRVASNYLLSIKTSAKPAFAVSFEDYAETIDSGQQNSISYTENLGEQKLLEEEVKVSCTHGLLLCLSDTSRLVYILGELLELNSAEGAQVLEMSAANFRKILSRARDKIRNFLEAKCGLANSTNPCRCHRKVDFLISNQVIDPRQLRFAAHTDRSIELVEQIDALHKSVAIYQSTPQLVAPEEVIENLRRTIRQF
ncbi:MAG: RNA polymerase sigma factor [Cyclobacteriaceae bacterium]|nr:RNA polymerase sigma factor [Cyclobacteriaceae bacterium HetDA_MAG_MS6]